MAEFTKVETHVEDGLERLLECFKFKPNMRATCAVILKRVQHIEDVLYQIYEGVWLDNAVGVQLDNLGDIVGEKRKGRQDEQYRLYIRARIKINRSNGKIEDTLAVARLILESTAGVFYLPEHPAAYRVLISDTAIAASDIATLLREVKPAGVQMNVEVAADTSNAFILNTATPLTNGFNNGLMGDRV